MSDLGQDLLAALGHEWAQTEWVPIYDTLLPSGRRACRDCGGVGGMQGGATPGLGIFDLCNACAGIDGCQIRPHTPVIERRPGQWGCTIDQAAHCENCGWWLNVEYWDDDGGRMPYTPEEVLDAMAEHGRPKHTSHWGMSHEIAAHDGLVAKQKKRREAYVKAHAV